MTVMAGAGDDRVWANAGNDTVFGGDGDDTLDGGIGHDDLYGGAGADEFVFYFYDSYVFGVDIIADFEDGIDQISFRNAGDMSFDDLTIKDDGDYGSYVEFGPSERVYFDGVDEADLGADDFMFA